jgi:single-stranded-DNA-specific exonuclease
MHKGKEHGIEVDSIPTDTKLVVAIDASSNENDIHKELYDAGIDVLVLDHHYAEIPDDSTAIIINNQTCDYPTKSLCGAAIVWKFCSYIDSLMNTDYAQNYLDLVAVALISDVMDLRDFETRRLVDLGLQQITNPFLAELVQKNSFSLGSQLTPHGVAFYIGPYINAVNRSGTQEEKLTLFESMLDFKGRELILSTKRGCSGQTETRAEQACRNCMNIKNR